MKFLELAGRISARWSASGAWSAATLEAQLGGAANCCAVATSAAPPPPSLPLLTVKVNADGHRAFSYDEGRLAASARRTQLVEMSARELFELCRRSEVGPSQRRAYFTSPVAALLGGDELLARHPEWRDLIHPLAARPAAAAAVSAPHLSLWIGGLGTQTQAHYDNSDNVFLQLAGRKRFFLWSPAAAAQLHQFPDAHCRARKSQIEPFSGGGASEEAAADAVLFPLAAALPPPVVVDLEPGDALTVPAFTFHHVEVLSSHRDGCSEGGEDEDAVSVSANCFTQLPQHDIAAALLQHSLVPEIPIDGEFDDALRAARRVLDLVVRCVEWPARGECTSASASTASAGELIAMLVESRFAPLNRDVDGPIALEVNAVRASASAARRRRRMARDWVEAPHQKDASADDVVDGGGGDVNTDGGALGLVSAKKHAEMLVDYFVQLGVASTQRGASDEYPVGLGSAEEYARGVALLQLWHLLEMTALQLVRVSPTRTSMEAVLEQLGGSGDEGQGA
tara:strand:- start:12 stop:1541 length:1530 start_codon:yes stop_codon:yes gene_type:complete